MKTKGLEEFIRYVKDRAYDLKVRASFHVSVSVIFIINGSKIQIANKGNRKVLTNLAERISYEKPETIEIEIFFNGQSEVHFYKLNYSNNLPVRKEFNAENNFQSSNFNGLGNVEEKNIESIINKRLEEERKERELNELKTKINENNDTITKKEKELESLKAEIEEQKEEIESLQQTIENKSTFQYYAGLTGDVLQSFGIKKEIIAKPLAGLLTGEKPDNNTKAIAENTQSDNSGIVDDDAEEIEEKNETQTKRDEMIALISEYLKGVDNQTLTNIFSIFSEIENNPNNSNLIIEFLNNK